MSRRSPRNSVLVIDDDPDLRSLIGAIAEIYGVPLLEAVDCAEGLNILEREYERLKLIILDYYMPGMEPAKCAKSVIAKAGPRIPVVLLTAAFDPAARAAELKINSWISKPFDVSRMTDLLTKTSLALSK